MARDDFKALGTKSEFQFDEPDPSVLEHFPNPSSAWSHTSGAGVLIVTDEFTSLCPKTGQPDWARIVISYMPVDRCVESKSLKLYLAGYRNHGEFHEACVDRIKRDLVSLLEPKYLRVEGRFTPRGGISFWPVSIYSAIGVSDSQVIDDMDGMSQDENSRDLRSTQS